MQTQTKQKPQISPYFPYRNLTISSISNLLVDFKTYKLLVKATGGMLVKHGATLRQVQEPDTDTPVITYVSTDHLGSVNITTNSTGTQAELLDYYPYGNQRISTGSSQRQYIGEEYDVDTSLSYLNARYYNGERGQFVSQDPVFWEIRKAGKILLDPQRQNSYSYAGNNPITKLDPGGKEYYEIEAAVDISPISFTLGLRIDIKNGRLDVGYGGGAAGGASATLVGYYSKDNLPKKTMYSEQSANVTASYGLAVKAGVSNTYTIEDNRGVSRPRIDSDIGLGTGIGISESASFVNYHTVVDAENDRSIVSSIKNGIERVSSSIGRLFNSSSSNTSSNNKEVKNNN